MTQSWNNNYYHFGSELSLGKCWGLVAPLSNVRHWLGVQFLQRVTHWYLSGNPFWAAATVQDKQFVVDARRKGRQDVGLSPFAKKADVLGLRWEQGVEFW